MATIQREQSGETTTDPVCGMELTRPKHRTTHEGIDYGFCSQECLDEFQREPARYARGEEEPTPAG